MSKTKSKRHKVKEFIGKRSEADKIAGFALGPLRFVLRPYFFIRGGFDMKQNRRSDKGFTLIELMIVVAILGLLAAFLIPKIMDRPEDARRTKAQMDIATIKTALRLYRVDNGSYPTTEQGLRALVVQPEDARHWREGGYFEDGEIPKDPWNNDYIYELDANDKPIITSFGRDGLPGGNKYNADISSEKES